MRFEKLLNKHNIIFKMMYNVPSYPSFLLNQKKRGRKRKIREPPPDPSTEDVSDHKKPNAEVYLDAKLALDIPSAHNSYYFTAIFYRLFEYEWPLNDPDSAQWYMLQEHVAEFLDVRGLQRKYPGEWIMLVEKSRSVSNVKPSFKWMSVTAWCIRRYGHCQAS